MPRTEPSLESGGKPNHPLMPAHQLVAAKRSPYEILFERYGERMEKVRREMPLRTADAKPNDAPASSPPSGNQALPNSASRLRCIAERFDGLQKREHGYMALCPAHDDSKPSLSIDTGDDGRVLIHCFAGCQTRNILEIMGLEERDLFPANPMIVATYDYRDEKGDLLCQVCRMDPKSFPQRRPDGRGGWIWNMNGVRRVLYRLPELLEADPKRTVFLVEGEKDADRLAKLGLVATTSSGGAGKWKSEYAEAFRGRHVAILPDNDDPGRAHAEKEAESLVGIASSVKVVSLPDLPEKGDVSDWLDMGGTPKKLTMLVSKTPSYVKPASEAQPSREPIERGSAAGSINQINATPATPGAVGGNQLIRLIPPKLGADAYYGVIGDFIRAVSPYTEATDAGILAHLLPAIGTLIGPGPFHWAGNRQTARINTVLVGPTSTGRKGTSLAPVDLLMNITDDSFWREQRASGLSSGEGLISKVADQKSRNEDGEIVIIPVEKRLYIVEEEFSKVFAQAKREGNTLSQIIREAFDSGNLNVLTRNPLQAHGAHISFTGHITVEELAARMSNVDQANGFGNRFLWFVVKSDKIMSSTSQIPQSVFLKFAAYIRAVADRPADSIPLAPDAIELWKSVYPDLREDRPGLAGAMSARGQAIVLRVALIYSILDAGLKSGPIQVQHLRAALAVWAYSLESCYMLFESKTGTPVGDKLVELLTTYGSMKKSQFTDHISRPVHEIDDALKRLAASSRVRVVKAPASGPGRPPEVWELIPPPKLTKLAS